MLFNSDYDRPYVPTSFPSAEPALWLQMNFDGGGTFPKSNRQIGHALKKNPQYQMTLQTQMVDDTDVSGIKILIFLPLSSGVALFFLDPAPL